MADKLSPVARVVSEPDPAPEAPAPDLNKKTATVKIVAGAAVAVAALYWHSVPVAALQTVITWLGSLVGLH